MKSFYDWLARHGFKHTSGNIHWNNAGWWFPELPDVNVDNNAVPGWWIWVSKDRESNTVFIDQQSRSGREGLLATDEPERAIKTVEAAMLKWMIEHDEREEGGGLSGYRTDDPRVGRKVKVWNWNPPFTGRVVSATKDWLIVKNDETKTLVTLKASEVEWESGPALDGWKTQYGFKKCTTCGRIYGEKEWFKLPPKGIQVIEADEEGPEERLDLRDCVCGSTLAVQLE